MRVKATFAQPLAMFYNNFALFLLPNQSCQSRKTALANDLTRFINSVISRQIEYTPHQQVDILNAVKRKKLRREILFKIT